MPSTARAHCGWIAWLCAAIWIHCPSEHKEWTVVFFRSKKFFSHAPQLVAPLLHRLPSTMSDLSSNEMPHTLFEKIVAGDIPSFKVYEDAKVYAFLDINPLSNGALQQERSAQCAVKFQALPSCDLTLCCVACYFCGRSHSCDPKEKVCDARQGDS